MYTEKLLYCVIGGFQAVFCSLGVRGIMEWPMIFGYMYLVYGKNFLIWLKFSSLILLFLMKVRGKEIC